MIDPKIFSRDIDKLSKVRTPKRLFAFIEDEVAAFFEVSYLDIFVLNDSETEYVLEKNITKVKDASRTTGDIKLDLEDPIIMHLLDIKKAFLRKEINDSLAATTIEYRRIFLVSLMNKLAELETDVCVPGFVEDRLVSVFVLGKKMSKEEFSVQDIELFSSLVEQAARVIYDFNLLKKEEEFFAKTIYKIKDEELFVESIRKMNDALEAKDPYTKGHADRVAQFSVVVGKKLHEQLEKIPRGEKCLYYAAVLHDVGKINIPDSILKKESSLTDEEFNKMKMHPFESMKIINPMEKWFGKVILDVVLYHHENYDGTGYPYGRKGYEINFLARIIRVSDSFDAMISDRPYRKALVHDQAISELEKGRRKQYDPKVVDAFLEAYQEGLFKDIFFSQLESKA